ncbi:MAG: FAD-binding oxidoreductase [Xanthobacteraceae bacterium]
MQETVAADYGRSWYAATAVEAPIRPPLVADLDVDACVIGGGVAGLTAAREIARLGWSVVVLEAKRVAWNASGRNCGFVLPGFGSDITRIVERVGIDDARNLWTLSEAGVEYIRATIHETEMPGVQMRRGWLEVSKVDNGDEMIARINLLGQDFGAAVEGWPTERVREVLRTDQYFHAAHYPRAFHIHPLNYALGLARAAEQAGVRIFEQTPALEIDPAGVRKRILTPSALLRAGQVILAGNTHIAGLMPELAGTLLPLTSHVVVTEPLGSRLSDAVAYQGAVSDTRRANYHYRIVDGDRLMWAGGGEPFARGIRGMSERLKTAITRTYPQLGDIGIAYSWSGVMGFTVHRMPQIGEISPGLWVASGFGGHGLNTGAIAGNLVARAIADNDDHWRAFLPYELVWSGGMLGRAFAEAQSYTYNFRERFEAKQAQKRERKRREAGETLPPPNWDDARAASEQAVADVRTDEAYDMRSINTWPYERQPRAESASDEEFEASHQSTSADSVDWLRAKRTFGPDNDQRQ